MGGLLAVSNINFNGKPIFVDSFDSSDPTHSVWQTNWFFNGQNYGTYTNTLRSDNAMVGIDGSNINLFGTVIYGYVDTAPGGFVLTLAGDSVGDLSWIGPNPGSPLNTGIQPRPERDDMGMLFNDVALPIPTNLYYPAPTWLSPDYYPSGTNMEG